MKTFIFDLDGTLLNTLADIGIACNVILGKHGYPQHPIDAYRQMVGNGFEKLAQRALPYDKMPDACAFARIVAEMRAQYSENMAKETLPYPGIVDALHNMKAAGAILCVLSNKPNVMTGPLIKHYFGSELFTIIRGALPDAPLKPAPEALFSILQQISQAPDATAYIGDSNVDMETARNAKVAAIGAGWGFRGAEELKAAGADLVLSEPSQLPGILNIN